MPLQRCVYAIKFMLMQNTSDCRIFVEKTANECQIAGTRPVWAVINLRIVLWDIFLFSIYSLFLHFMYFYYFPVAATFPQMVRSAIGSWHVHWTHCVSLDVVLKCGGCPRPLVGKGIKWFRLGIKIHFRTLYMTFEGFFPYFFNELQSKMYLES